MKTAFITPRHQAAKERKEQKEAIATLSENCTSMATQIAEVLSEVKPNGESLIKVIHRKVEHIQARVKHQDETSDTPIFELDANCSLMFVNCAFRELVNAEEHELKKRNYVSRVHPDDRTRFLRELEEAIDNKCPIDSTVRVRVDGTHFTAVRMLANPDVRPDGELRGFFGTASKVEVV